MEENTNTKTEALPTFRETRAAQTRGSMSHAVQTLTTVINEVTKSMESGKDWGHLS